MCLMQGGPSTGPEPVLEKTSTRLAPDSGVLPARGHTRSALNSYTCMCIFPSFLDGGDPPWRLGFGVVQTKGGSGWRNLGVVWTGMAFE